eukprot:CAMPEP_0174348454 /NCGR_PEP_ID=MMETSP0811_2-20130205/4935_1 /TAXON_ID=73025 ORGANISM="Eutreptiella gymnastica-like, Strain CCMP1594" /NCGR_SAMPLE_ID=MMETSP0811_2 /ASSEMBLY_ACC=CAM_ASM_000667 /LENGTH=109 /DNA_ID=CAMNT_0015475013 /DNA_START=553 /DNA_END=882 /DNA_ORIENTATION=+
MTTNFLTSPCVHWEPRRGEDRWLYAESDPYGSLPSRRAAEKRSFLVPSPRYVTCCNDPQRSSTILNKPQPSKVLKSPQHPSTALDPPLGSPGDSQSEQTFSIFAFKADH